MSGPETLGKDLGAPTFATAADGIMASTTQGLKAIRYPNQLQDIVVLGKVKSWQRNFLIRPIFGGQYLILLYPEADVQPETILSQVTHIKGFNGAPEVISFDIPRSLQVYSKWNWRLVRLQIGSDQELDEEMSNAYQTLFSEPYLFGEEADRLSLSAFRQDQLSHFIYDAKAVATGRISFDEEGTGHYSKALAWSCHQPYVSADGKASVWQHVPGIFDWYSAIAETFEPHRVWALGDTSYSDGIPETDFVKQVFDHQGWYRDHHKREDLLALYRLNYRQFWSFSGLQQVMRNYPHLAMWDDHEIRDGYGSDENHFKEENKVMKDIAHQAAQEYLFDWSPVVRAESRRNMTIDNHQAYMSGPMGVFIFDGRNSRNYGEDLAIPTEVSQTIAIIADQVIRYFGGDIADAILDELPSFSSIAMKLTNLYRWKNAGQVISEQQLKDFERFCVEVQNNPNIKYVLMGNSVPFIFVMDVIEALLAESEIMDTELAGELRDDIRDSWHSPANRRQLSQLFAIMKRLHVARPDVEFINVSGDIHISNAFTYQPPGFNKPLFQVTSSAITNRTTGDFTSDLISEGGLIPLGEEESEDFGPVHRLWHEGAYQNVLSIDASVERIQLTLHVYNHDQGQLGERDRVLTIRPGGGHLMEGPEGGVIDNILNG
jgi:hypothetical protein